MRIIFDSEEEQDRFFNKIAKCQICPSCIDLEETCEAEATCRACWMIAMPHEIKEPEEPVKDEEGKPACDSCMYWDPLRKNPICQHCSINSYNEWHHDVEANYWKPKDTTVNKCTSCIYLSCGLTRPDQGPCAACTNGSMYKSNTEPEA